MKFKIAILPVLVLTTLASSVSLAAISHADQANSTSSSSVLVESSSSVANITATVATTSDDHSYNNNDLLTKQFEQMNNSSDIKGGKTWFKTIRVSGLLNAYWFGQNNRNYLLTNGVNKKSLQSISYDGQLNFDATLNQWVKTHVGLFYANDVQPTGISGSGYVDNPLVTSGVFDVSATRYYPASSRKGEVDVDQAYIDVSNFKVTPLVMRVGLSDAPFGKYNRYAMMPTLSQQLERVRDPLVELAFVHKKGIHIAVYALSGLDKSSVDSLSITTNKDLRNWGASVNYSNAYKKQKFRYNLGLDYLYNMADVGSIAQFLDSYTDNINAWSGHATGSFGPFGMGINYVSALENFNQNDLIYMSGGTTTASLMPQDAKPSAGTIFADYNFKTYGCKSKATVSYQWSRKAFDFVPISSTNDIPALALPKHRIAGEYDVQVLKNTIVGFEVNYDKAYSTSNGGTDSNGLTSLVRLSVLL